MSTGCGRTKSKSLFDAGSEICLQCEALAPAAEPFFICVICGKKNKEQICSVCSSSMKKLQCGGCRETKPVADFDESDRKHAAPARAVNGALVFL